MEIKIIKINNIILNENYLTIIGEFNEKYQIDIIKGSIKCKIFNHNNEELYLNKLEEENIIKIYSIKNKIKKIIILNNYILSSESSDENII